MSSGDLYWDPYKSASALMHHYRLISLAIRIKGLAQMWTLYPYLEAKLNRIVSQKLEPVVVTESKYIQTCQYTEFPLMGSSGWKPVQIAPLLRECATGLLGVCLFGNTLCRQFLFQFEVIEARFSIYGNFAN